ncbi:hypothetical protein K435DRAFT_488853 [Dendrothele bispora CBS 962.96]|uniref:Uncharacterized protein n=1 Tax=Dendrothele bispora (strain CBS 962.96) TaxID=1314807 RepID=A0A4S8MBL4_DENBC|nr:hypothetical protein K435DRAFT_488853 [Dendrothele bispora CBS 962.96]
MSLASLPLNLQSLFFKGPFLWPVSQVNRSYLSPCVSLQHYHRWPQAQSLLPAHCKLDITADVFRLLTFSAFDFLIILPVSHKPERRPVAGFFNSFLISMSPHSGEKTPYAHIADLFTV